MSSTDSDLLDHDKRPGLRLFGPLVLVITCFNYSSELLFESDLRVKRCKSLLQAARCCSSSSSSSPSKQIEIARRRCLDISPPRISIHQSNRKSSLDLSRPDSALLTGEISSIHLNLDLTTQQQQLRAQTSINFARSSGEKLYDRHCYRCRRRSSSLTQSFTHDWTMNKSKDENTRSNVSIISLIVAFLLSLFLCLKSIFWARRGDNHHVMHRRRYQDNYFQLDNQTDLNTATDIDGFWDTILGDAFSSFSKPGVMNFIAALMIFTSTMSRGIKLANYLLEKLTFADLRGKIDSRNARRRMTRESRRDISIVQINLAYLGSLKTTAKVWFELMCKNWYHHHIVEVDEVGRIKEPLNINKTTLDCMAISTKMYAINMINFNTCYRDYFAPDSSDESHLEGSIMSQSDEKDSGQSKQLKLTKLKRYQAFASRPLHRCDLNEMAWLILMLGVLYILSFITYFNEMLSALLMELGLENLSSVHKSSLMHHLTESINLKSFLRWSQILAWSAISLLDTWDLFLYFACCMICLSRARYSLLKLKMISARSNSIYNLIVEHEQVYRTLTKSYSNHDQIFYQQKIEAIFTDKLTQFFNQAHNSIYLTSSADDQLKSILKIHNQNIKLCTNQVLLMQRELHDLKRYFRFYLDYEVIMRPICVAYCIVALLDSRTVYECIYIGFVANNCMVPILIVTFTAAILEMQFRRICQELNRITSNSSLFINGTNLKQILSLSNHLSIKSNRSFVITGGFALSLGILMPLFAWIATGVFLIRQI